MSTLEIRYVSSDLAVGGQISVEEVAKLKAKGFRSIICNRPNGEEPNQPTYQQIKQAAEEADLGFSNIPIVPGAMEDDDIQQFAEAVQKLPTPIFAYCRSGARSAKLCSLI